MIKYPINYFSRNYVFSKNCERFVNENNEEKHYNVLMYDLIFIISEILIDRLQKNTKDKVQKDDLWQMLYIADTDRDVELCIQMTRR